MRADKNNVLDYPHSRIRSFPGAEPQSTRLVLGSYFADIVPGGGKLDKVFHWVIQRVGSAEILRLGQEKSFSHALDRTHECLEELVFREENPGKRTIYYQFGDLEEISKNAR
jgi:hypothetical protein